MTSTDNTRGLPLRERMDHRMAELEQALVDVDPADDRSRHDIELALATAKSLTTGDVARPSDAVGSQLNDWLERNKHIGINATASRSKPAKQVKQSRTGKDDEEGEAAEGTTSAKPSHDGEETRSE